jgi:small GTP-binding protein
MSKSYPYRRRRAYSPPEQKPKGLLGLVMQWVGEWWNRRRAEHLGEEAAGITASTGFGLGLGALLNALDWDHVRAEVDQESRARIALVGAEGAGKSTLLNRLKGFETPSVQTPDVSETSGVSPTVEDFGLFAVIDLPACGPNGRLAEGDPAWLVFQSADLVLWMLDGQAGLRPWEYEWICRARSMGKALTVVLNKLDLVSDPGEVARLNQSLGCAVIPISARDAPSADIAERLLTHIADVSPNLTTALGREAPAWRCIAARRVIQRATALSGLVGVEPVPLLDIPFQVLIQLRLVLRLAAIYGEPLGDRYSRELLATIVSGVALRYLGQQLAKVIPLAGWAASGALAAGGTWAIGRVATDYFEHGRHVHWPRPRLPNIKR